MFLSVVRMRVDNNEWQNATGALLVQSSHASHALAAVQRQPSDRRTEAQNKLSGNLVIWKYIILRRRPIAGLIGRRKLGRDLSVSSWLGQAAGSCPA